MATDRCPSILGANQRLQRLINKCCLKNLPRVAWHHCILHPESLVAKSLKMPLVTKVITTTVNWIRANAVNHGKFKTFFSNIDADYGDVIVFTAVS